jgi:hypothetical protein
LVESRSPRRQAREAQAWWGIVCGEEEGRPGSMRPRTLIRISRVEVVTFEVGLKGWLACSTCMIPEERLQYVMSVID